MGVHQQRGAVLNSSSSTLSVEANASTAPGSVGANPATDVQNVTAAVIRPLFPSEREAQHCDVLRVLDCRRVQIPLKGTVYEFDRVFNDPPDCPVAGELYTSLVQPLVNGLFEGYNGSVIAYGQTGSGKTHTMGLHHCQAAGGAHGLVQRATADILSQMTAGNLSQYTLHANVVEVYMEAITDLLQPRNSKAKTVLMRPVKHTCSLLREGFTEERIDSMQDVQRMLQLAAKRRHMACNAVHSRSNRSHAVVTLKLHQQTGDSSPTGVTDICRSDQHEMSQGQSGYHRLLGQLQFVDLAGAERIRSESGGAAWTEKEAIMINMGLTALKRVCDARLSKDTYVPYRESKLTHLLQSSLNGNARTVMIACISPAASHLTQTCETLKYVARARHIHNKPRVNEDLLEAAAAQFKWQMSEQQQLIDSLRVEVARLQMERATATAVTELQTERKVTHHLAEQCITLQQLNVMFHDVQHIQQQYIQQQYIQQQYIQQQQPAETLVQQATDSSDSGATEVSQLQKEGVQAEAESEAKLLEQQLHRATLCSEQLQLQQQLPQTPEAALFVGQKHKRQLEEVVPQPTQLQYTCRVGQGQCREVINPPRQQQQQQDAAAVTEGLVELHGPGAAWGHLDGGKERADEELSQLADSARQQQVAQLQEQLQHAEARIQHLVLDVEDWELKAQQAVDATKHAEEQLQQEARDHEIQLAGLQQTVHQQRQELLRLTKRAVTCQQLQAMLAACQSEKADLQKQLETVKATAAVQQLAAQQQVAGVLRHFTLSVPQYA